MSGDIQKWDDGGDDVTSTNWMKKNKFKEIKKNQDIKAGDIIIFGTIDPTTGKQNWKHTFIITEYNPETGKCSKIDYGKDSRIHTTQPFQNVDFDEWNSKENDLTFIVAYRPDYETMASGRNKMRKFRTEYKEADEQLIQKAEEIKNNYSNPTQRLIENLSALEGHQKRMNQSFTDYDYPLNGFTDAKKAETDQNVVDIATILDKEEMSGMPDNLKFAVEAATMHKYLENTNNNANPNDDFQYYVKSFEGLPKSFENLPDDVKHVCCATYVSWVMKLGGYMTDEEGGNEDMHLSKQINQLFEDNPDKFEEQNDYDNLMPGDILYYSPEDGGPHIEIFAGYEIDENNNKNNVVLGCGSNYWISAELPTTRDDSSYDRKRRMPTKAWRIKPYINK